MEGRDIASARASARLIIQQIVQDEAFAGQLREDPRSTLLSAGFPDWAVDDFIANDLGIEPDVAGYALAECRMTFVLGVIDDDGLTSN